MRDRLATHLNARECVRHIFFEKIIYLTKSGLPKHARKYYGNNIFFGGNSDLHLANDRFIMKHQMLEHTSSHTCSEHAALAEMSLKVDFPLITR